MSIDSDWWDVAASKVKVRDIRKRLGFGPGYPRDAKKLTESTVGWRETYIVWSNGTWKSGFDLVDKNTPEGRNELLTMAKEYVDCYGKEFWPPGGHPESPEYPRDSQRIVEDTASLMCKQNEMKAKNIASGRISSNVRPKILPQDAQFPLPDGYHPFYPLTAASPSDAHSAQLTDSGPANDQHQGSGPSPTCFTSTSDQNCYGAYDPVAPKVMSPRGVADSSTGPKQRLDIHHYTDLEDEQRTRPKNSLIVTLKYGQTPHHGFGHAPCGIAPVAPMTTPLMFDSSLPDTEQRKQRKASNDTSMSPLTASLWAKWEVSISNDWEDCPRRKRAISSHEIENPLNRSVRPKIRAHPPQLVGQSEDGFSESDRVSDQEVDGDYCENDSENNLYFPGRKKSGGKKSNTSGRKYKSPKSTPRPGAFKNTSAADRHQIIPSAKNGQNPPQRTALGGSDTTAANKVNKDASLEIETRLSADGLDGADPATKQAPKKICTACRRKKIECDEQQPCSECGTGTGCTYVDIISQDLRVDLNQQDKHRSDIQLQNPGQEPHRAISRNKEHVLDKTEQPFVDLQERSPSPEKAQVPFPCPSTDGTIMTTEAESQKSRQTAVLMSNESADIEEQRSSKPPQFSTGPFESTANRSPLEEQAYQQANMPAALQAIQNVTVVPARQQPRIRYYITVPKQNITWHWNSSIFMKSVGDAFDEVSRFVQSRNIDKIQFEFKSSMETLYDVVTKDDETGFKDMKQDFNKAASLSMKRGIGEFVIKLRLDLGEEVIKLDDHVEDSDEIEELFF